MNLKNEVEKRIAQSQNLSDSPVHLLMQECAQKQSLSSSTQTEESRQHEPEHMTPRLYTEPQPQVQQSTRFGPHQAPVSGTPNRPTAPAVSQTDLQKPQERWSAETLSRSPRSDATERNWTAKLLPLLAGIGGLGTVLLLLHIIHTLF